MNRALTRILALAIVVLAASHATAAYQRLHSFGDAAHSARIPMAGLTDGGDGYFYGVSRYATTVDAGTIFKVRPDGADWSVIYTFVPVYVGGQEIYSHLAITNGVLYGTRNASFAGSSTSLAFSVTTNGTGYTVLHNFNGLALSGKTSSGGLVFDAGGFLYGVTSAGGTNGGGTVFKMQTNGAGYVALAGFDNQFLNSGTNARTPIGELVLDANNFLYGVTSSGGSSTNGGTIFKIKTDGTGFARLLDFPAVPGDGYNPMTGLALDAGGNLFGVTASGGTNDVGVAFKLKTDGTGYARLHDFNFDSIDVFSPDEKLCIGGDGLLYGAAANGGTHFSGGLFKLGTDGSSYSVFYNATGGADHSSYPVGGVTWLPSGAVLAEASSGGTLSEGSIFKVQSPGAGFTTLASFIVAGGDATQPQSGLTLGNDGYLYGTTFSGGAYLGGTLYKISTNGTCFTLLHEFQAPGAPPLPYDGFQPTAAPVLYSDGFLYGTTTYGGTNSGGIIYKIRPDGTGYAHVHDFAGGTADGSGPAAELSFTGDGILFGTTQYGGTNNSGVVFKGTRNGTIILLHHFGGNADGGQPTSALTFGADGFLYGTAQIGGALNGGTVFKLKSDGSYYTNLYSFDGNNFNYDGQTPISAVVFGPDGFLYGTTPSGGFSQYLSDIYDGSGYYYGAGTIFKMDVNGLTHTNIYSFENSLADPAFPQAGLTLGSDGLLYGTAEYGGAGQYGEVFKIDTNGTLITVCSFRNSSLGAADGSIPYAGVTLAPNGVIYGTTLNGGDVNLGTVFSVDPRVTFTDESKQRNGFHLAYQSIAGTTVTLQRGTNLMAWTSINTNTLPNNADGFAAYLDVSPPTPAFYRAVTP